MPTTITPEFLRLRRSVRNFTDKPLDAESVKTLKAEITMINTHEAGMYFELVTDDASPFEGFKASYGMFRGVRNYIAVVAETSYPDALERAGYFAEHIVMKAVSLGMGTCFVGGTFAADRAKVNLRAGRKLLFLIALGYAADRSQTLLSGMAMKFAHRHDRPYQDFYVPAEGYSLEKASSQLPWLVNGLKGVACAPSSLNKQPVRIRPKLQGAPGSAGRLTVTASVEDEGGNNLIDLGISKYNFAKAAGGVWEWGNRASFYPAGTEQS